MAWFSRKYLGRWQDIALLLLSWKLPYPAAHKPHPTTRKNSVKIPLKHIVTTKLWKSAGILKIHVKIGSSMRTPVQHIVTMKLSKSAGTLKIHVKFECGVKTPLKHIVTTKLWKSAGILKIHVKIGSTISDRIYWLNVKKYNFEFCTLNY